MMFFIYLMEANKQMTELKILMRMVALSLTTMSGGALGATAVVIGDTTYFVIGWLVTFLSGVALGWEFKKMDYKDKEAHVGGG